MLVPLAVRRSDRVIADSQSSPSDLVELLRVAAENIDVAPQGLGAIRASEPLSEPAVRRQLQLGERRVVLSLSAKRPHKNLPTLIEA